MTKLTIHILLIFMLSINGAICYSYSDNVRSEIKSFKEPLVDVLEKLEDDFEIHFLFKSGLLESVEVDYVLWETSDQVDEILDDILNGTGVLFRKINANSYILVPDKKTRLLSGVIKDQYNRPLIGATLYSDQDSKGAVTDLNGYYEIDLSPGNQELEIRFVGYRNKHEEVHIHPLMDVTRDFSLEESTTLDEIVVLGSKFKPINILGSARPLMQISKSEVNSIGYNTLNEALHNLAPSFHSTFQTISDGTDHITPASMRGLGPDQLLVLINGKRRHHSSLLNINGTIGRGTVATDLNTIPASAIEDIEILSEDAVALYGSDAIAGVINIRLKESMNYSEFKILSGVSQEGDGQNYQLGGIIGTNLGKSKGFLNLSMDFSKSTPINRAGPYSGKIYGDERDHDHNIIDQFYSQTGLPYGKVMEIGAGGADNAGFFLNMELPIAQDFEIYAFGGLNYRLGKSRGFYRFPYQDSRQSGLYPDGFSPILKTQITDVSTTVGIKRKLHDWNLEVSNTYGQNLMIFRVENSNNASLGLNSPVEGKTGGFEYGQNVLNVDAGREFGKEKITHLGFGLEFKYEKFSQSPGEEDTYRNGGSMTEDGRPREIGMQLFPGFRPQSMSNENRISIGTYLALENELTSSLQLDLSTRLEYYENFGAKIVWNTGLKYNLTKSIVGRIGAKTGFRAPSMPQANHQSTSFQFLSADGELLPFRIVHIKDESAIAQRLRLDPLKPETSLSYNIGLDYSPASNFSFKVDAYQIEIFDRIVLSGIIPTDANQELHNVFGNEDVSGVQFLSNAINTSTKGFNVSTSYFHNINRTNLTYSLKAHFGKTVVLKNQERQPIIATSSLFDNLDEIVFNREEVARIESGSPNNKIMISTSIRRPKWTARISGIRFGSVTYLHPNDGINSEWALNTITQRYESRDQRFRPKIVLNLSFDYTLSDVAKVVMGINNVTNIYPDQHTHSANISDGNFRYSRRVSQFGVRGRYFFSSLTIKI